MTDRPGDEQAVETLKNPSERGSAPDGPAVAPALVLLLCAEDLDLPSARHWMDGLDEVRIFRGKAGPAQRRDRILELPIADPYASTSHVSLHPTPEGIRIRDEGSTNGTSLDGHLLKAGEERLVRSGILEVGHTFFHLRFDARGTPDAPTGDEGQPLTFHAGFGLELFRAGKLVRRSRDLLVTGESGAGKEVIARWLHGASGRQGPLVALNCVALPENLLEDELFGHVKGAYSGAQADRQGMIRAADGGTLLLDEIGEMPASLQAKLLRVLEDRRVRPIGSEREIPVDLQVIAATHRDLRSLVAEGRFREDLLARLGLLTVRVPPVRDRREDLGLLMRSILGAVPGGPGRIRLELEVARALLLHEWPLNVRQLRTMLLAAVDLASVDETGPVLVQRSHLSESEPPRGQSTPVTEPRKAPPAQPLSGPDQALRDQLASLLAEHRGNVAAVARAFGKPRTHVQRLMARLGLRREDA
jgi:transcriptional regulator with AAA-type ATPase domain